MSKETELKVKRQESLKFLQKLSQNYGSENDSHEYIKKCVTTLLDNQKESIAEMEKYVKSLADDERTLEEKIKRKNLEIERANKRLKSMSSVKPAFVEELERNEKELERLYTVYLEKFRNLDWLEHEVDKYNDIEYQRKEMEK